MLLRPFLKHNPSASKNQLSKYVAVLLVSMPFSVFCQELDIKATVNTTGYTYETQIGDEEATQSEAILIKPSIIGSYSSRTQNIVGLG